MRIALLSYRSKTHCGGQGVYVRHLSRGLVELGHDVEVFSGQPYPERLDPRVRLTKVPSLDLYREPDPFRVPRPSEIRDRIDLLELCHHVDARAFPNPGRSACASARLLADASRRVRRRPRQPEPGHRAADHRRAGLPVVATVHHPITRDRVLEVAAATWWRKPLVRRWYGFAEMQKRVARRIPELLTVSSTSAADIAERLRGRRRPAARGAARRGHRAVQARTEHRVPGRIIAIASADVPLKGVSTPAARGRAAARGARSRTCSWSSKLEPNGPTEKLIAELGISDIVHSSQRACPTTNWPPCWRRPRSLAFLRFTKASRCRRWRRWPAARRSWPAARARCPRCWAPTVNAPDWCRRAMSTN